MNIRVALQFYPNQANPARPSGRGVYRVVKCWHTMSPFAMRVIPFDGEGRGPRLYMMASREFKRNSRVDPLRIALDYRTLGVYRAHIDVNAEANLEHA